MTTFLLLCQGCRALPLVSHSTDAQPLVSAHTRLIEASQAAAPCPLVVSKPVARICLTCHTLHPALIRVSSLSVQVPHTPAVDDQYPMGEGLCRRHQSLSHLDQACYSYAVPSL